MKYRAFGIAVLLILCLSYISACNVSAQTADPPVGVQTLTGQLDQLFTLTTSNPATYSTASGAMQPMPDTQLNFQVDSLSVVTISFSARGSVQPSGSQLIPIVFIGCNIDGQPCQPDSNSVEFLYPQFCCDTRAFQWVAQNVATGSHQVQIVWGMGNPTSAVVTNRTLIVQAATP
jgi:hypothetical protein